MEDRLTQLSKIEVSDIMLKDPFFRTPPRVQIIQP